MSAYLLEIAWSVVTIALVIGAGAQGYLWGHRKGYMHGREYTLNEQAPYKVESPIPEVDRIVTEISTVGENEPVIEVTRYSDPRIPSRVRVIKPEPEPPANEPPGKGKYLGLMIVGRYPCGCEMASMWAHYFSPEEREESMKEWRSRGAKIFFAHRHEGDPIPPHTCPMHANGGWPGDDAWGNKA